MPTPPLTQAVILAAGKGMRLRSVAADKPKVMVELRGKPLLHRHVDWLRSYGVTDVFINLHYRPECIQDYFQDGREFGVRISYSHEEVLQGTAGALRGFRGAIHEPFLLHYGDVYADMNVRKFHEFHCANRSAATLVVHPSTHPHDSDIVVLGKDDQILELHHKPGDERFGDMGNAACYILEPSVFDFLAPGEEPEDFIQDVFPRMLESGARLFGYQTDELLLDMGTPGRLKHLNQLIDS